MLSYSKVQGKPHVLQSLTGLKPQEFETLLVSFDVAWQAYIERDYVNKPRARSYGGGRRAELASSADKLLFILVYFRLYPTQTVQGFLFGICQSQACEWVHKLHPLLNEVLGYEQQLPERQPARLEAVLQQCPSLEFMIDGADNPLVVPRTKTASKPMTMTKRRNI